MVVTIGVDRDNLGDLLTRGGEVVRQAVTAAVWEAEQLLQREVQEGTPTAMGALRQSITAAEPLQLAHNVIGLVSTSIAHAAPVEFGTRPHWAPLQPLIDWVVQRDLAQGDEDPEDIARLIRFKIAARGTQGHHMFERAYEAHREQVLRILDAGVGRAAALLDGGAA